MNKIDPKEKQALDELRHSAAHLLAAAVLELYPDAKPTIGPAIDDGFYYDFEFSSSISEQDLPKIEKKMREVVKSWSAFTRQQVSADEARQLYANNPYKGELIDELEKSGAEITLYKSGAFTDLCRGGHVEQPAKELRHFKLLSVAGAYWRG
ncbi:MAG: threonine--tRNA ligase, partial [Candidatus Pacebacteria bacterium CG10_big_fil_rev_8_21_14_0_10_45_6]